jgi:hypothetical protein
MDIINLINNKFENIFTGCCRFCNKKLTYEIYCYKCIKKINKYIDSIDNNIEIYINSLSYTTITSMLSSIRQLHADNCFLLGNKKKQIKSISDLYFSFMKEIKHTLPLFDSYKDLYDYSKNNLNNLFKNDNFGKKLKIKIDNELKSNSNIFSTDLYNYEYDKQLFIVKTIENIKALMELLAKEKIKEQIPYAKLGKYMKTTKKTDGTINQGKLYAYGKILDVLKEINTKEHDIQIIQVFREFLLKDIVKGENMFFDGLIFLKVINERTYHPVVIELDDMTHDRLTESKYRLNDFGKNIFCKKNGISLIRLDTVKFNLKIIVKILKVIASSKKAKLVTKATYEDERIKHFNNLSNTYDLLNLITEKKN